VPVAAAGLTAAVNVTGLPVVIEVAEAVKVVVVVIGAAVTVTVTADESPVAPVPYFAVTLCVPTARVVVVYVATPDESALVPRTVVPSMNVTLPLPPAGVTVAVNVTDVPAVTDAADAVSVVVYVVLPPQPVRTTPTAVNKRNMTNAIGELESS